MNGIEIVVERETANDETAMVAAVFVESGKAVAKDELVFEIESSKATEEYYAPEAGILLHDLSVGQTVNFGVAIARVVAPNSLATAAPVKEPVAAVVPALPVTAKPPTGELVAAEVQEPAAAARPAFARFSHAASELLQKYGVDASRFDADFVTAEDVQAHVDCLQAIIKEAAQRGAAGASVAPPVSSNVAATATEPMPVPVPATGAGTDVGQRKRAEIQALGQGAGATLLSVLGVTLGPLLVRRQPDDFLAGRITDLVLYEASRLMRKYPRLNACYVEGRVVLHEAVHAGLAIDDGGRLMVYGLEHTDKADMRELSEAIGNAVARYLDHELTNAELSRATFTVTDLSDGELDFVFPLLPRGQSCILGITCSSQLGYRLFAGFDHRVTEGREVTAFLGEMRDRLLSFSSPRHHVVSASVCEYCARSVTESISACKEKGLLKVVGRDGREVLCCGSCWSGW